MGLLEEAPCRAPPKSHDLRHLNEVQMRYISRERNIVIHLIEPSTRRNTAGRRSAAMATATSTTGFAGVSVARCTSPVCALTIAVTIRAAATAAAKHLHLLCDDLG